MTLREALDILLVKQRLSLRLESSEEGDSIIVEPVTEFALGSRYEQAVEKINEAMGKRMKRRRVAVDHLSNFMREHCVTDEYPDGTKPMIKVSTLYARYKTWASAAGETLQPRHSFIQAMRVYGHDVTADRFLIGISLRANAEDWAPKP